MRVVPNFEQEFEEVCREYSAVDQHGRDLIALIRKFGDQYDHLGEQEEPDYRAAWTAFLEEHQHQINVAPLTGMILYILCTYWLFGKQLYANLPILEKMLVRDTVVDISTEIDRVSAANSG